MTPDDLQKRAETLDPAPARNADENAYWREGSRRIIADALLLETMAEVLDAPSFSDTLLPDVTDKDPQQNRLDWPTSPGYRHAK